MNVCRVCQFSCSLPVLDFINGTQVPSGDSWSPFAFARLKAHGKLLFKIRQKNNLIDKDSKQTPVVLTSLTAWQQILTKVFGHWALGVSAFMNNQRNPRPLGGDSRLSPGGRLARQCHHGKGWALGLTVLASCTSRYSSLSHDLRPEFWFVSEYLKILFLWVKDLY
jgi:hypothetical protein